MANSASIILQSLGIQASVGMEEVRAAARSQLSQKESLRHAGESFRRMTKDLQASKARGEIGQIEALFSHDLASGNPENFSRSAEALSQAGGVTTPEAQQHLTQRLLSTRQLGRQDAQDERLESQEDRAEAAGIRAKSLESRNVAIFKMRKLEHAQGIAAGEQATRVATLQETALNTAMAEHSEDRANEMAVFKIELDTKRNLAEASKLQLGEAQREASVEELVRSRIGEINDMVDSITSRTADVTSIETFDDLSAGGRLDRLLPQDDPIAVEARAEIRDRILRKTVVNAQVDATLEKNKRDFINGRVEDIRLEYGQQTFMQGRSAVNNAFAGWVELERRQPTTPADFFDIENNALIQVDKWVKTQFPDEEGFEQGVLGLTALEIVGDRMNKLQGAAIAGKLGVSKSQASMIVERGRKWVSEMLLRKHGPVYGGKMTPEMEADAKILQDLWQQRMAALEAGKVSATELGVTTPGEAQAEEPAFDEAADKVQELVGGK